MSKFLEKNQDFKIEENDLIEKWLHIVIIFLIFNKEMII